MIEMPIKNNKPLYRTLPQKEIEGFIKDCPVKKTNAVDPARCHFCVLEPTCWPVAKSGDA